MSAVEIRRVITKVDLERFIDLPWSIYEGNANWVPPVRSDLKKMLSDRNPFFSHAERELFLAYKNGVLSGRIAAILDRNFCKFQNEKTGFFSFYESIDDIDVARALFNEVFEFHRKKEMTRVIGPTNPSTNDEMGWTLDGYDSMPYLMMPYNMPYYHSLAEKNGFTKAKDLNAFLMDVQNHDSSRLKRINDAILARNPGLSVRSMDFSDFEKETRTALDIYNSAWEKNWGFVPWTREEFIDIAKNLKNFILPETAVIAEHSGRPVGMMIAVPDYNPIIRKANGSMVRLLWYFFTQRKRIKKLRVMIMGVIKEYRKHGIEGLMYMYGFVRAKKLGFTEAEFSWILEDNTMTNRTCEMMGGRLYKRYRVYGREL